jgi:hypothetical protein
MSFEVWKPVPSLPGFHASSMGRIKVDPYQQPLPKGGFRVREVAATYGMETKGRMLVVIRRKSYRVHVLVAEAWHGPRPAGMVVMHMDEDFRNNKPSNLQYGTQKENLNHPKFLEYCRSRTGENNPRIKGRLKKAA